MPRSDRGFTGQDIARLYCRNLPRIQKIIALELLDLCAVDSDDELALAVLTFLIDLVNASPLPGRQAIVILLDLVREAVREGYSDQDVQDYLYEGEPFA